VPSDIALFQVVASYRKPPAVRSFAATWQSMDSRAGRRTEAEEAWQIPDLIQAARLIQEGTTPALLFRR